MTAFMLKWKRVRNEKYKENVERLVQQNMLEKNQYEEFVYIERGSTTYVVLEKSGNGFLCTLMANQTQTVFTYDVSKEHSLFEKIDQDYRIWESIEQEEANMQLQGLSKNKQAKYKKLLASSME